MIDRSDYEPLVVRALAEDLGAAGDITSAATVSENTQARGEFVSRTDGVVAGVDVASSVFEIVDPTVEFEALVPDGSVVKPGATIAVVSGSARSILTAERTALNLFARMSGVATATAALVAEVEGTGASISDTRKTMPGMRVIDKYAVLMGGGVNHRMGLYDAVMIKDNHLVAAGGLVEAVATARESVGPDTMVEVEVESIDQLELALQSEADRVLLDNMDLETLTRAVAKVGDRMVTEASGGVTLESVRAIAETGVDIISVGWITHSAPQLDIGLDFTSSAVVIP
jgi:nicotinate-nucleotide pyrophosphorylase (carboxylating)